MTVNDSDIKQFKSYLNSGARASASQLFYEISRGFLPDLNRLSPPADSSKGYLVHYTSLNTLFSMLDRSSPGYLRLYDTIHANDPSEGSFFRNHITSSYGCCSHIPPAILDEDPGYAYIVSFVGMPEISEADNLIYWLAYGCQGYGCSIAFPYSLFSEKLPLFRMHYGEDAAEETANLLISFLNLFDDNAHDFITSSSSSNGQAVKSSLSLFQSLQYFHKPVSFSYEHEYRILLFPSDSTCDPKFVPSTTSTGMSTVRHYVNHPDLTTRSILGSGTIITIGPAVPLKSNVARTIKYLLKCHGLGGFEVGCSSISYRPHSL